MSLTLFDKLWDPHVIAEEDGEQLIYIDRCLIEEGSRHVFARLEREGRKVKAPESVLAFADHYVPSLGRAQGLAAIPDPEIRTMLELIESNTKKHDIRVFGMNDPDQGILHVVPPELGLTLPGMMIAGQDSHAATHGAFGSCAFGIGWSDVFHVLTTRALWLSKPLKMRINLNGKTSEGVYAKDLILAIISQIGVAGGTEHAVEYAGSAVEALGMEGRMTLCNMSIEAGARAGMIAPDETTYAYLNGRRYAPKGKDWDAALASWKLLHTDAGAMFDREVTLDASAVQPMVTWGTNPGHACPVTGHIPDPSMMGDADQRAEAEQALRYIGLEAGQPIEGIPIDQVFIGSCTNSRLDDLRAAADIAKKGRAKVPAWVVPGSQNVRRAAEAEGLDQIFRDAGFEWREPGCSLCTAINGDIVASGKRCASTSNRNFQGRQGTGSRTHLMSPAMAAAAAISGVVSDVRRLI